MPVSTGRVLDPSKDVQGDFVVIRALIRSLFILFMIVFVVNLQSVDALPFFSSIDIRDD